MTQRTPVAPSPPPPGAIAQGDALARESQWRAAVSRWIDGYAQAPPRRKTVAEQRVRWLIHESGPLIGQHNRKQDQRRNAYRSLWLSGAFGAVATVLIVLGTYTANGTSPVLSIAGWIGILGSVTCAIVYTFRLAEASPHPANSPLTADEIARAKNVADELDRGEAAHHGSAGDRLE